MLRLIRLQIGLILRRLAILPRLLHAEICRELGLFGNLLGARALGSIHHNFWELLGFLVLGLEGLDPVML